MVLSCYRTVCGRFKGPTRSLALQSCQLIESLGVSHTEVGRILVNGSPVGLDYQVYDGDRIAIDSLSPADLRDQGSPVEEGRILLTRDRRLLKRCALQHGYCVRSLDPGLQIGEVVRRYELFEHIRPFQRCLRRT